MSLIPKGTPAHKIWHVCPSSDAPEHVTTAENRGLCWCRPSIEIEGSGYVVVHNALDPRLPQLRTTSKPS